MHRVQRSTFDVLNGYQESHETPRRRVRAILIVITLFLSAATPAAMAASNASCDKYDVRIHWHGSWTASEKADAMVGFNVWEWDVDKYDGTAPAIISESSGAYNVDVEWGILPSDVYGVGICNLGDVAFNSTKKAEILANLANYWYLAAHEMGHAIGIDHVAKFDSYDGDNPPLMWSCGFGSASYRLSQDDSAAMQLQTDLSGAYRSATANSSFEEDDGHAEFWGVSSGTTTLRHSGGVDGTPYYMGFRNTSSAAQIFSTTALIDDPTIDWVQARANYLKNYPGDYGTVTVQLRVRTYDVGGSDCGFPSRRDGAKTFGTATYYSTSCTPGVAWAYCTTSGTNPATKAAETGGVEVRILVTNNMFSPQGTRTYIGVDRVRVMVDY